MIDEQGRIVRPYGSTLAAAKRAEWTVLEAVAWIGSRDMQLVSGVAPFVANYTMFPVEVRAGAACTAVKADIAKHCECSPGQDPRWPAEMARVDTLWEVLSPEQKADPEKIERRKELEEMARSSLCRCYDNSAKALFDACAAGDLVGHGLNSKGEERMLPRSAWSARKYNDFSRIGQWSEVLLLASEIQARWPARSAASVAVEGTVRDEMKAVETLRTAFASREYPVEAWTKPKFWKKIFEGHLSKRAFDRAWARAAEEHPERMAKGRRAGS